MTIASEALLLDAVAGAFVGVQAAVGTPQQPTATVSLTEVYAAGTGLVEGVAELPDDMATAGKPALVILAGPREPVISGGVDRITYTVLGQVWNGYQPRAERYRELLALVEPIRAKASFYDKANAAAHGDEQIQSMILTGFDTIVGRQWQRQEGAGWFLVLPFTLEVKYHRDRQTGPSAHE